MVSMANFRLYEFQHNLFFKMPIVFGGAHAIEYSSRVVYVDGVMKMKTIVNASDCDRHVSLSSVLAILCSLLFPHFREGKYFLLMLKCYSFIICAANWRSNEWCSVIYWN